MARIPADIWYLIGLECDYPTIDSLRKCNRRLWNLFKNQDFWWRMILHIDRHVKVRYPWQIIDRGELTRVLEETRTEALLHSRMDITHHFEMMFLCLLIECNKYMVMPGFEKVLPLAKCLKWSLRSRNVNMANYYIEKSIDSLRRNRNPHTISENVDTENVDPERSIKKQKYSNWDILSLQRQIRIVDAPVSWATIFDEWIARRYTNFTWDFQLHRSFWFRWLASFEYLLNHNARESRANDEIVVAYQAMPQLAYLWLLILIRYHRTTGRRRCHVPKYLARMLNHIPLSQFRMAIEQMEQDGIVMECNCLNFRRQYNIRARWWWNYLVWGLMVQIIANLRSSSLTSIYEFLMMILLAIVLYFTSPYQIYLNS